MSHTKMPDVSSKTCFKCGHIGLGCLTVEEWCDWCIVRKNILDLTNQEIADEAGVSKISVDRVMSHDVKDLRVTTMQVIAKVLKKGLPPQPACGAINADNTAERIAKLLEVIDYLRLDLERKNKIIDDYLNRKGR